MSEEIMTQFRREGESAFQTSDKENDNSTESSPVDSTDVKSDEEKNETDQTQSPEGDTNSGANKDGGSENLADNPRWQEREADWNKRFNDQELRHADDLKKFSEDFNKKLEGLDKSKTEPEESDEAPPDWFGGDETEWKRFQAWNNAQLEKAQDKAVSKVQAERNAEQKHIDDATAFLNKEIAAIENDRTMNPKGGKIDRDQFLKFVMDNKFIDYETRSWDYRRAFKFYRPQSPSTIPVKPNLTDRKNLANATTQDKGGETKPPAFATSGDFLGKNWGDIK